jgi:hypothetical protein
MRYGLAWQCGRQRTPCRFASLLWSGCRGSNRSGIDWGRIASCFSRFQIFEKKFELLHLAIQLLRASPKLHALQLENE